MSGRKVFRLHARVLWLLSALLLIGCGTEAPGQSTDAGATPDASLVIDAGGGDAGPEDAGSTDAGTPDAGPPPSCAVDNGGCAEDEICTDEENGVHCEQCGLGYQKQDNQCVDIGECELTPSPCGELEVCSDVPGSYTCTCIVGYSREGETCVDVDECATNNGGCQANSTCFNTAGSFECRCNEGFTLENGTCVDIDECNAAPSVCDNFEVCSNAPGSYSCDCKTGYARENGVCVDVDECLTDNGSCQAHSTCRNTAGSRECDCDTGYRLENAQCVDLDECAPGAGVCDPLATCVNAEGTFACTCPDGYTGDGLTCTDVDECATDNGGCHVNANCTNLPASAPLCECKTGYSGDGFTCTDIDECAANTDACDTVATCANTAGSYQCTCPGGSPGNGFFCIPKQILSAMQATIPGGGTFLPPPPPPGTPAVTEPLSERGLRFRVKAEGKVYALTYRRPWRATGTDFTARLWRADTRQLLASAALPSSASNDWTYAYLDQPIAVSPGIDYIVSYSSASDTTTRATPNVMTASLGSGDVFSVIDSETTPNGVRGAPGSFPDIRSPTAENFFIDVIFARSPIDCATTSLPCVNASCAPTSSSVQCLCNSGYELSTWPPWNNTECVDTNECEKTPSPCGPNSTCVNSTGSFTCGCKPGFVLTNGQCTDIDECQITSGLCGAATCTNTPGYYACDCPQGQSYAAGACYPSSSLFSGQPEPTLVMSAAGAATLSFGSRFRVTAAGRVMALRYYRLNSDDRPGYVNITGRLWDSVTGQQLATTTFTGYLSGWQTAALSTPVSLLPGRDYYVTHDAPENAVRTRIFPEHTVTFSRGPVLFPATTPEAPNGIAIDLTGGDALGANVKPYGRDNFSTDVVFLLDDRCGYQNGGCGLDEVCQQTGQTVQCSCAPGYTGTAGACVDEDECTDGTGSCPTGTSCRNTVGAYTCDCPAGFAYSNGACVSTSVTGPFSMLSNVHPGNLNDYSGSPVALGLKFRATTAGIVTALRYYRSPSAIATDYVGHLWDGVTQQQVASVNFTGTQAGWQEAALSTPVALVAGRTYVVSYWSPTGLYFVRTVDAFTSAGLTSGPLEALASGVDGLNGVYAETPNDYPAQSYRDSNYFADVVFLAGAATGTACPTTGTGCDANASCTQLGTNQFQCLCNSGYRGDGRTCWAPSAELTGIPESQVATGGPNSGGGELGVKFRVTAPAYAVGVRYYRPTNATVNNFTGRIWDTTTQQVVATVPFNGTASGWVTAYFPSPIELKPGRTYISAYSSPTDLALHRNFSGMTQPFVNGLLRMLADGEDGSNGVYAPTVGNFPTQSYQASNYFADVIVVAKP